jgi:hypothetical protein
MNSTAQERRERHRNEVRQALREEIKGGLPPLDGGISTANALAQLGRPMSSADVIARLKRMNPNLHFEVAIMDRTKMGVYVLTGEGKRFICGMEHGYMPEFSYQHTSPRRTPDPDNPGNWLTVQVISGETRGWRTVLARLLRERLITLPQIERYFNPAYGRSSERWQRATR